jgi:Protein of unknown function (DUF3619)
MSHPDKTTATDQVGRDLGGLLRARAERLDPSIEQRLATARQAALLAAAEAQRAPELVAVAAGVGGKTARQGGRWSLLLPATLLLGGLLAIAHSQWLQETLGLADRDATVLRDKLPPTAYGDPGFNEYLDEKPETETPPPDEDEAKR